MKIEEYCEARYRQHPGFSSGDLIKINIILKMIGSGNVVLDIGSFDGTIARRFQDCGNKVFGADIALSALKLAKKKINNIIQIPFNPPYPFKDKIFDVVFVGEVIEHILDTDSFLSELKRITKDNGYIIITTPNVASLGRRMMLLLGINPYLEVSLRTDMSIPGIGHIRYFTKSTLFELLRLNSLKVIELKSDAVFLNKRIYSRMLAKFFPTLGRSLIVKCIKG